MSTATDQPLTRPETIAEHVTAALEAQPIIDKHTHLYPPSFGTPDPNPTATDEAGLLLWGVDELLTYHYLIAEVFRVVPATTLSYADFWKMSRTERADHIWKHLFIERTPISEACRGVLTSLKLLGLDPDEKDLRKHRQWFAEQDPSAYIDRVMELSNVASITMTNEVFNDNERQRWLEDPNVGGDPRFEAVLRIDPMLREWPRAAALLREWGYEVQGQLTEQTIGEAQRFLRDWIGKMNAIYLAVSLPPAFRYPSAAVEGEKDPGETVLEKVILPVCKEQGLPFAMMIGSKLRVNPALQDAGDMVGKADVQSVVNLCAAFPHNKFFCTMLSRENQHELCVAARKFGNLMIFGCWWFLNNPSIIEEITRERLELLGTSMIPQHSDARVLDQLTYKWNHSREVIGKVLTDKYHDLARTGWSVTDEQIRRDVRLLLHDNFREFVER